MPEKMTIGPSSVKLEGPLFDGKAGRQLNKAMLGVVTETTEWVEEYLLKRLRPQPAGAYKSLAAGGTSTGNYRRNINSRIIPWLGQGVVSDNGVVYGAWLEGTSSRNDTTRFKGYRSFRNARDLAETVMQRLAKSRIKNWTRKQNRE